jgi:hypothetical protein
VTLQAVSGAAHAPTSRGSEGSAIVQILSPPDPAICADDFLYFGTSNQGVYRSLTWLGAPTGVDLGAPPGGWLASFPNPFRTRTTIAFSLGSPATASLAVYDIRGRLVATPMHGRQLDPGAHAVAWEPGPGRARGVYFYRLVIGERTRSGKGLLR